VPGFDFLTPQGPAYIIWILGGLFLFVGGLFGVIAKMGSLMFQWRREIDKDHAENAIEIAKFESVRRDIERLFGLMDDLQKRITQLRESRLLERRHRDDMEDDN